MILGWMKIFPLEDDDGAELKKACNHFTHEEFK